MSDKTPLLELRAVGKRYGMQPGWRSTLARMAGQHVPEAPLAAVAAVSLAVARGEVLGLVGESGSGKSTLGRMAAGLLPLSSGSRWWKGKELANHARGEALRSQLALQMIFQDPSASLNPRMRAGRAIMEAPVAHRMVPAADAEEAGAGLLRMVGLDPSMAARFPHQLSGGQRARVGIARALAVQPEFLVCDEATAALDVSIQAQILNLFMRLRSELGLTYLFISHDLAVVRHISDRIAVMYMGQVVELAPCAEIYERPAHPYSQALLDATPSLTAGRVAFAPLRGELADSLVPPSGCYFQPRCPHAMERCKAEAPRLQQVAPLHFAACHLHQAAS